MFIDWKQVNGNIIINIIFEQQYYAAVQFNDKPAMPDVASLSCASSQLLLKITEHMRYNR
jgi:hypothetical protein